jgi:hypothetical protein
MSCFQRSVRRDLVALVVLVGWVVAVGFPEAHAGVVVSTLDLPNDGPFPGDLVGAAIQIGDTPISLTSVVYTEAFSGGPTLGETFAIFSRNADGTVGSSLFTGFTLSYDSSSQNTTATATSPFTFQANTSYWLMMVETPGTFGDWDSSLSFTYTSAFGVTIPDTNASFSDVPGTGPGTGPTYLNASDGLQLFQLNGNPATGSVPEPTALLLAATGGMIVLLATGLHRRRRIS